MKSLIIRGVLIAALAFTGNAAMAANSHATNTTVPRAHAPVHVAMPRAPRNPLNADLGPFIQSMLGAFPQYSGLIQNAMRARGSRRSSGSSDWSPTYDNSPDVSVSSAAADSQAASDAENQAIQSMNDTNAMNASMAAAEQMNDAANAAAIQTEINANN
jgi:hypothetical protein